MLSSRGARGKSAEIFLKKIVLDLLVSRSQGEDKVLKD
jgi:hypothetical protein